MHYPVWGKRPLTLPYISEEVVRSTEIPTIDKMMRGAYNLVIDRTALGISVKFNMRIQLWLNSFVCGGRTWKVLGK